MAKEKNLDLVKREFAAFLTTERPTDDTEERLTGSALREIVEVTMAKKFPGQYIRAVDVPALQTAVRAAARKKFPGSAVTLQPLRGGGFSVTVDFS